MLLSIGLLALLAARSVIAQDCQTKGCPSGCCSKYGYCGFGPDCKFRFLRPDKMLLGITF